MALYQMRQRDPLVDPNTQALLERRARELIGLGLIFVALVFVVMLGSYSPADPGWMVATDQPVQNWLGRIGAAIASTLMIIAGQGAWALPLILCAWGVRFVLHRGADRAMGRVVFALIAVAVASVFAATHVPGADWPHSFGLGGLFGDTVLGALLGMAPVKATFGLKVMSLIAGLAALGMMLFVTGFDAEELRVIRHFLMVGSVLTYSQVMLWAGKGTAGASRAAVMMQERQRQRRADAAALRAGQAYAAEPAAAPEPMERRSSRVVRAEAEAMAARRRPVAEPVMIEDDLQDELPLAPRYAAPISLRGGAAAVVAPALASSRLAAAPRDLAPSPMRAPQPVVAKPKGGLLNRLRRVVEPDPVMMPEEEDFDHLPPEDRIKARISDVIRTRVRLGMGAAAPQPHMTPLQAAIARREPVAGRAAKVGRGLMEPPVMAVPQQAPAPAAPASPLAAAVAGAAARAAAAQAQLAQQMARPVAKAAAAPLTLGADHAAAASNLDRPAPLMRPASSRVAPLQLQPEPEWEPEVEAAPLAYAEDGYADAYDESADWEPDDNFEPDFDPTPVVPRVALGAAPSRSAAPMAAPRLNAVPTTAEVKRVVQHPVKKPVAPSTRAVAEAQPRLRFEDIAQPDYELPPLSLLTPASTVERHALSDDALEENARMLESVLDDYGVKGEIVSVRPGPVVTMYELEPAPGLKASRVIGLADDIARSMSALSARVSTVPGRSVIGIELPNATREKVVLREILSAREFGDSAMRLPLALGKDIGGDPIVANLAKMPHLLIAGTTGSGKSVAINTMILSLLYKLSPEECRLIMIDPKMLELSVYDGIPHLLSPVVTDPKKAVVALKWVVGEMEERYRKMSKMGVRNIDGYNGRVREAIANNEMFKRTIQTGFDEDTGEPVFETEEFQPVAIPYIVVIVDEMADLMMVAGKEIEACIQRLAQMARASGIHLIMATQRPSVDVITGTIKANFPTRISFQVTSKIDSRTILGEQGAEQLLGMGDMLYMGNGARITRIHGPFVSDEEVEEIVNHLKSYGPPVYMSGVVEGPEDDKADDIDAVLGLSTGGNTDGEDALYDQAVAIVAKDRKCSTSYIQRKLGIGYNKAARLVEQMEEEGVVTSANHVGKREILIPEA
ncbi:DNA segregation ATPase FtsK/SpoIIIE, S-DNA-T family [Gemmobacter aquatilis]|uniref:DNA translocase FtsK n=1 Tax=Gemmobacter aquatilis TaxID=933059 RepID=A0A1H8JL83_9RHOB|nr:DNA translocase FtsK [Gemmobacter aquatilis]SEN81047.1 DNA segregation ATPase FtsK/SpoIIIE, S-DNA-T family [Gemmobacter aquatilis]